MAGTFAPMRLAASAAIGLALATAAGLHAASAIAIRSEPALAADLFFANAEARELAAFEAFTGAVTDPEEMTVAAASVRGDAIEALRRDPTSAKALALLALGRDDKAQRNAAALAASQINRRDLMLQGLVLEAHLDAENYPAVVETLDQILRVHPRYLRDFAPVLGEALRDSRNLEVFDRLVGGSSFWQVQFFQTYALGQPDLLPNLALLRAKRPLGDDTFDSELIARLAREGYMNEARTLFALLSEPAETQARGATGGARTLGWEARFPPFDWNFTDQGDFRGQASLAGDELEIFARPGRGGIVAQRIIDIPEAPFEIATDLEIESASRSDAIRAELRCAGADNAFAAQALASGRNVIRVSQAPGCDQMEIAINARAWSGESALRARLGMIEIASR